MKDFPARLLFGARGSGVWESLRTRAAALLCESEGGAQGRETACGACPGCALLAAGTHPDLRLLLPPALALELGVGEAPDSGAGDKAADKRNPSKEIGIDDVRALVDWAHATSHRGAHKVALIHPLDSLGPAAANALLKTLEEPPPGLCFLMGTHRLDRVLPTLRSRCVLEAVAPPDPKQAVEVLRQRGEPEAEAVAHWCRGGVHAPDPGAGLPWARELLAALAAGSSAPGPLPAPAVALSALQKICTDVLRLRHGHAALYLPGHEAQLTRLGQGATPKAWLDYGHKLGQAARFADFPLHAALAVEAWVVELTQLGTSGTH